MHSPAALGCGARPNQTLADIVVGVLVARLLGNRHPSPYMYHATFLCLIACVVNTTATSHVAQTRDPFFPTRSVRPEHRVREARRVVLPS